MEDRDELARRQEALQAVYDQAKEQLMQIPGVVGVGIGLKEKDGEPTSDIAFRVYVEEKKELDEIPPEHVIPQEVMGFRTDVITVYQPKLRAFVEREDTTKYRPIKGGICINAQDQSGQGTLGWFGTLNSDSSSILLTNKHVVYSKTLETTTDRKKVGQSSYSSLCCCECGKIGETIIGIKDSDVDAAIVRLDSDTVVSLVLNNAASTQEILVSGTGAAVVGETVRKIGMRSGFTTGTVIDIGAVTATPPTDPAGTPVSIIPNQILIRPVTEETYAIENGKKAFSNYGDSGSVILNASNQIIGLLYSGDEDSYSVDITFANNISRVLTALNSSGNAITLSVSPPGGDGRSSPARLGDLLAAKPVLTGTLLDDLLEQTLEGDPSQEPLIQAIQAHYEEIVHLVNHRRPVTVTWHRKQGPAFLAAFMRSVKEPAYSIPQEIEGVARQHALTSLAVVFEESASPQLKASIQRYSLAVIYAASRFDTAADILTALKSSQYQHVVSPDFLPLPIENIDARQ